MGLRGLPLSSAWPMKSNVIDARLFVHTVVPRSAHLFATLHAYSPTHLTCRLRSRVCVRMCCRWPDKNNEEQVHREALLTSVVHCLTVAAEQKLTSVAFSTMCKDFPLVRALLSRFSTSS